MSDPVTPPIAAKYAVPIAGVIGAFLSLAFVKNLKPMASFFAVFGGAACSYYFAPAFATYIRSRWELNLPIEETVGFVTGLIGMNLLGLIWNVFKARSQQVLGKFQGSDKP